MMKEKPALKQNMLDNADGVKAANSAFLNLRNTLLNGK